MFYNFPVSKNVPLEHAVFNMLLAHEEKRNYALDRLHQFCRTHFESHSQTLMHLFNCVRNIVTKMPGVNESYDQNKTNKYCLLKPSYVYANMIYSEKETNLDSITGRFPNIHQKILEACPSIRCDPETYTLTDFTNDFTTYFQNNIPEIVSSHPDLSTTHQYYNKKENSKEFKEFYNLSKAECRDTKTDIIPMEVDFHAYSTFGLLYSNKDKNILVCFHKDQHQSISLSTVIADKSNCKGSVSDYRGFSNSNAGNTIFLANLLNYADVSQFDVSKITKFTGEKRISRAYKQLANELLNALI